jgi:RNA polymerase sigma-54 factor
LLQPKLNLKVSQRQVLTPGLVQMVSVLALNKLELKEMINAEIVENPVLEEIEESCVTIEERAGREAELERPAEEAAKTEKDPFDEIDFGSYFQDYLDPGFRTSSTFEDIERPSFDNFLSQPSTLSDHLIWQLGAMKLTERVRLAAELIIGNLNGDGYLIATDEELAYALKEALGPELAELIPFERGVRSEQIWKTLNGGAETSRETPDAAELALRDKQRALLETVAEARHIINRLDPIGVGARDLRECLLIQIRERKREAELVLRRTQTHRNGNGVDEFAEIAAHASDDRPVNGGSLVEDVFEIAAGIVRDKLQLLQKRDVRELTKSCGRTTEEVQAAVEFIRTLDPRPGQRYDTTQTRLIEPDVAFVKRDGEYVVVVNEDDMPSLRLSHAYRKMMREKGTEKDVRDYVKERYKSAIQLLRNIEQRKNTIVRTCEVIVRRQQEFLERGEQALKPMMIKEVAEEIGVHPSTVSRAVANKYVHTPQGVYELRYFFSEGVNGPEGAELPLVLLKRKVKKLIEDEDASKPLTDDQLAAELQRQGIQVTRRTVAKYREDMQIPSTHQRRVRC